MAAAFNERSAVHEAHYRPRRGKVVIGSVDVELKTILPRSEAHRVLLTSGHTLRQSLARATSIKHSTRVRNLGVLRRPESEGIDRGLGIGYSQPLHAATFPSFTHHGAQVRARWNSAEQAREQKMSDHRLDRQRHSKTIVR